MAHTHEPTAYSRFVLVDSTSDVPDVLWSTEVVNIGPGVYGFPALRTIVVCFRNHDVAGFATAVEDLILHRVVEHLAAQFEEPKVGDRIVGQSLTFEVRAVEPNGDTLLALDGGAPTWLVAQEDLRDLLLRGALWRATSENPGGDQPT